MHRCAWDKQESEDIMVYADVHVGNRHQHQQGENEGGVDGEIARHFAFDTDGPSLTQGDGENGEYDDDQGRHGSRLLLEVMWGQALDWDLIKGVVVQGAHPAGTEPENGFFELSFKSIECWEDAGAVDDEHDECRWKKSTE